jgi:hypothetical protein
VFHNSGKTIAEKLEGYTVSEPVRRGESPNFSYTKEPRFSAGLVPPGSDHHVRLILTRSISKGTPSPLTQPLLDALNAGEFQIYIHGRISYDDIFGAHHWMTFCYFWHPETRAYAVCAEHNEIDGMAPSLAHEPASETWALSDPFREKLIERLTGVNGKAIITINLGDEQSRKLATQLIATFERAHWVVNDTPNAHNNTVPIQGIQISSVYGGSAPTQVVNEALKSIGFHPHTEFGQQQHDDVVYIFVGVKE